MEMELDTVCAAQPDPKDYPHKPLTFSASITLLELLPSREKDAPMRCQVREFALTDEPHSYEALPMYGDRQQTLESSS